MYGILVLFNATYLYKLQDGVQWERVGGVERQYCRRNWWANLFYQNSGFNLSEMVRSNFFCFGINKMLILALNLVHVSHILHSK